MVFPCTGMQSMRKNGKNKIFTDIQSYFIVCFTDLFIMLLIELTFKAIMG